MTTAEAEVKVETNENVAPGTPEWLEAKLFEPLLQQKVPDYKSIRNFKVKPAMGAGENYATIVLRIEIEVELKQAEATKTISFIMKVPLNSEMFKEWMENHNVFTVESNMYEEVVPELEQLCKSVGVEIKFSAQPYKLATTHDLILLEDLGKRGFRNANRLEGLDMEHTQCVLRKLAQWHAASAVRVETKGNYSEMYVESYYNENGRENIKGFAEIMARPFLQSLNLYEGHELYKDAILKLQDHMADEMFKYAKPDPSEFNVLNHGDCWSNNIMFQYDAFDKIKETYFVDYQMPKYGTPAQDLYYFLLSSTKLELKLQKFEYFIKFYHDQLVEHLKLLNYTKEIPCLRAIHIMLYKYGILGYSTASGVMAGTLLDPNENANVENLFNDSEAGKDFKLALYSNPRYRKHIEVVLPWLYNRGALEL